MEQISEWVLEARNHLSKAKTICGKANNLLNGTNKRIENRNLSLVRINYYLDAIKGQLHLLGLIRDSMVMYQGSISKQNNSIDELISNHINNLEKVLRRLSNTRIEISHSTDFQTLHDFISVESIEQVKMKLSKIQSNKRKFYGLLVKQTEAIELSYEEYNQNYRNLESEIEKTSFDKQLNQLVVDNGLLESDLVSILKMLTNHFDQCSKSVKIFNTSTTKELEKKQLFEVLSTDVLELPEVLKDLENNYQIIVANSNRIDEYCTKSTGFEIEAASLICKLNDFGETKLIEIYKIMHEFNSHFLKNFEIIDVELENIKSLVNYYSNFESSYFNLILEINRRNQMNLKIANLVTSVSNKLKNLEAQELELRKKFLDENADFLPSNIWDGLNNSLPRIDISQHEEKLPTISEEILTLAKRRAS